MSGPASLSVVVIPLIGGMALDRCLTRLAADRAERIVVLPLGEKGPLQTNLHHGVRFISADRTSVPWRRQVGVEASGGDIVAIIEDTSVPSPGWCEAVRAAFTDPAVGGAGGPVFVSPAIGPRFQALGCSEYGRFHPRRLAGLAAAGPGGLTTVQHLPGNNLAYRRALLLEALSGSQRGLFEIEIDDRLRTQGAKLVLQPGMAVEYAACDAHGARLSTRFRHGRLYAGRLVAGRGWPQRAAAFTKSLLLPPILAGRALRSAASVLPPAGAIKAAPWICAMEAAWAAGEAVGSLTGEGHSENWWQ